ncbi:MAG: hypothetical protein HYT22_03760 [Candidatus Niyogibacteria bacterium]|nr:hypothetical protein [Candidatus Niyogibacteria bacterium]
MTADEKWVLQATLVVFCILVLAVLAYEMVSLISEEIDRRKDERRIYDLEEIYSDISNFRHCTGQLPSDLEELRAAGYGITLRDSDGNRYAYSYEDRQFELCSVFSRPRSSDGATVQCFQFGIDPDSLPLSGFDERRGYLCRHRA